MSRGAKLNYMTVTVIEQYFHIPCSVLYVEHVAVLHGGRFRWLFVWLPQCWGVPVKQLGLFPHLLLVWSTFVLGGG